MTKSELKEIMGTLDKDERVKDYANIFKAYYNAFSNYEPAGAEDKVMEMLKRKLFLPLNLSENANGVLIVGANPSFRKKQEGENVENFMKMPQELYEDANDVYWKEIKSLATYPNTEYKAAYLDLFPIKQTDFKEFEGIFRPLREEKAKMLQVTHQRMIALQPKVIVNLFAMTSYYWGLKRNSPETDFLDEKHPWMGYRFEKIEAKGLEAYKIIGWSDDDKVILPNDKNARLKAGTIVIFGIKRGKKEELDKRGINAEKLQKLLEKQGITL